jgi:hypothetical protein
MSVSASSSARTLRSGAAVAGLALVAACGSTAQVASTGYANGPESGLTAPSGSSPSASHNGGTGSGSGTGASGFGGTGATRVGTGAAGTSSTGGGSSATGGTVGSATTGGKLATRPVKIGILLTTIGNADAVGYKVGNTYAEQQFDDAVINSLNKQGGLHGRRIIPVYAKTNTASSNWETDFQAACSTFTEDNHVDVVLGSDFAYFASFEKCLAKAGIPHLSNTSNVPDNTELGQFPLLRALIVPTIDKRSIAKLQGAINTGFLTPANKLGVITDSCPGSQRAWNTVVKPFLAQHHIPVVATADEGCANGYNDSFSAAGAAVGNAILTFRSHGVDRITFITVSEGPTLLVMSGGASSQKYYPGWIVSSLAGTAGLQGQAPADEMKTTRVYGWLRSQDVSPSQYDKPNQAKRRCLSLLKSQGVTPASSADYSYSESICEALFAYEAALGKSGGVLSGPAVIQGLEQLGTSVQSVFSLHGAANFSPVRRNDVPRLYREAVWQDVCSCFAYQGTAFPIP